MEIKIGRCIIVDYGHVKIVGAKTDKVECVLPRYAVWDTEAGVMDGDGSDDPNVLYERFYQVVGCYKRLSKIGCFLKK
jgi:hypothetical protein